MFWLAKQLGGLLIVALAVICVLWLILPMGSWALAQWDKWHDRMNAPKPVNSSSKGENNSGRKVSRAERKRRRELGYDD